MKAIINGKRYDTEKAELVASDSYGFSSDFQSWEEELYRTPRGSWFLWGEGGPMTKYAESSGQNSWGGSSRITPLTPQEVKEWLENHRCYDELDEYFGDQVEDA